MITGNNARKVKLVGDLSQTYRPVLRLGKTQETTWPPTGTKHDWLIHTYPTTLQVEPAYLERVEIENLILDGDFAGQAAYTGPANMAGYKSFAIDVNARTGLIRNVLVRNFGAVGALPWTYYFPAGTETFPVSIWTYGNDKNDPADWNPYPWLIESV